MATYQFALKDGSIVNEEYDGANYYNPSQVKAALVQSFGLFNIPATVEQVDGLEDVFHVTYPSEDIFQDIYICAKGTTPGGRSGLKDEQRIQPKAKFINYVYNKKLEGSKGVFMGVYDREDQIVLCTWPVSSSSAATEETPISKQIKITSIAKAIKEGFVQQDKGKGEYACAFKPEFLYFYLRNCDWLHGSPTSNYTENAEHEEELFSNRDLFKAWLNTLTNELGEKRYTDGYITNLSSAPSQANKNHGMPDIYAIDDIDEYLLVKQQIEGDDNFQAVNIACGNRALQPALDLYKDFLQDKNRVVLGPKAKGGFNKIYYGAPGCGKSRFVKDMLEGASVDEKNIVRVTFHPEFANCDFIGQILPTVEEKTDSQTGEMKEIVKYIFNPGPFTLALQTAYNTDKMVYLIVEEINRGNAAAIFGDMFQLLDRTKDENDPNFTASEYPVSNPNMQKYLLDVCNVNSVKEQLAKGIFIPSNLTILATMNSSDQNVFTLDTAFKRRWLFEQISNDIAKDDKHAYKGYYIPGTDVKWSDFLTKINDTILDYKIHNQTNEDKRLGKYFVTKDCLTKDIENISDVKEIAQNFAYKVLEYIWNDVCKIGREDWFDTTKYKTLEDLIAAFVEPKDGDSPLSVFQIDIFR